MMQELHLLKKVSRPATGKDNRRTGNAKTRTNFMVDTKNPKIVKRYVEESWKARLGMPCDKDFIAEFLFSCYAEELKEKEI